MPGGKPKVFGSFNELRRHYFPKQWKKEQQKSKAEQILEKAKTSKELIEAMDKLERKDD